MLDERFLLFESNLIGLGLGLGLAHDSGRCGVAFCDERLFLGYTFTNVFVVKFASKLKQVVGAIAVERTRIADRFWECAGRVDDRDWAWNWSRYDELTRHSGRSALQFG